VKAWWRILIHKLGVQSPSGPILGEPTFEIQWTLRELNPLRVLMDRFCSGNSFKCLTIILYIMNRFPEFIPRDFNLETYTPKCVDNHCHLYAYGEQLIDTVISRAKKSGVVKIVAVSTNAERVDENLKLMEKYRDMVVLSVGYTPKSMSENRINAEDAKTELVKFLDCHRKDVGVFSIGEIGLYKRRWMKKQRLLFKEMLELAKDYELGINVHSYTKEKEVLEDLQKYLKKYNHSVVLHAFQGSVKQAREACNKGYFISIAPKKSIGHEGFEREMKIIEDKKISIENLLTESDGHEVKKGDFSEPYLVPEVAGIISDKKGMELKDACEILFNNHKRII